MAVRKEHRVQTMLTGRDHAGLVWLAGRREQNVSELQRTLVQDAVRQEQAIIGPPASIGTMQRVPVTLT